MVSGAKKLTGDALKATLHRGSHMQIIAAAGAGKTETVSQRVAKLLEEEVDPKVTIRDQPKLTHSEAQMVLKMVQKHPERRNKSQRSQWFKLLGIGE